MGVEGLWRYFSEASDRVRNFMGAEGWGIIFRRITMGRDFPGEEGARELFSGSV